MTAPKTEIEFLPQEEWEKGTFGKILKWALTVGRHVVIFTELIVILAFLSRFKLDRDLTDLGEEIKQRQAIIEASSRFEEEFRFFQKQLQTIENLKKNQLNAREILEKLAQLMPTDVYLSDFSINGKRFTFSATSLSEESLGIFLRNLKNSQKFVNLALSQVSMITERELGIKFQINGELSQ